MRVDRESHRTADHVLFEALYAARRIHTGDLSYDADAYETALADVVGGVFEFNGRNIIAPVLGMDEDLFENLMETVTQEDLLAWGNGAPEFENGNAFDVEMFESSFFGPEAQLVSSGFGRYLVTFPGLGFVQTETGDPYELDLGALFGD